MNWMTYWPETKMWLVARESHRAGLSGPVPTATSHTSTPVGGVLTRRQIMNKFITELQSLTPTDLLIVLFTPAACVTLSAAFFFGL